MPDSKVVYVNENSDSDDEIIYGEKTIKVEDGSIDEKQHIPEIAVVSEHAAKDDKASTEEVEVEKDTIPDSQIEVGVSQISGTSSNPIDLTEDSDEEPADEEPADQGHVDEQPVDEQPVDEQPVDEQSVDEQPVDEQPADEQPADEKPVDEQPADQEPEDEMSGGYASLEDDNESLDTLEILNMDPLYFRLTKFLQTRGGGPENDEPENVAEILKKINTNLDMMNANLSKFFESK